MSVKQVKLLYSSLIYVFNKVYIGILCKVFYYISKHFGKPWAKLLRLPCTLDFLQKFFCVDWSPFLMAL